MSSESLDATTTFTVVSPSPEPPSSLASTPDINTATTTDPFTTNDANSWSSYPVAETNMDEPLGYGAPYKYHILPEHLLVAELEKHANAVKLGGADCVSMQPCENEEMKSQDRYVVEEWEIGGGRWGFAAIFDGHAGEQLADYTVKALPALIHTALSTTLQETSSSTNSDFDSDDNNFVQRISTTVSDTIESYGNSIAKAVLSIFPGGEEEISKMTDQEISERINSEENLTKVVHGMKGTTALISLVDPKRENLWVASLGDCQAALGVKDSADGGWNVRILSSTHNGSISSEQARIISEHPNEPEVMLRNRVLGGIAVTRALGDLMFMLPRVYTERVFAQCKVPFKIHSKLSEVMSRNFTPPYLSCKPDMQHVRLSASERFLVMCSDGLTDLYHSPEESEDKLESSAKRWMDVVAKAAGEGSDSEGNVALALLRDAIGGEDLDKLSRYLTVEMDHRWMDDTTIIVQRL